MNKGIIITGVCCFGAGLLVGKVYYDKLYKKEMASLVEAFSDKKEEVVEEQPGTEYDTTTKDIPKEAEVVGVIKEPQAYVNDHLGLEIINVDIFGEEVPGKGQEYTRNTVYLYSDGVLAGEHNEVINDVDGYVGLNNLSKFGNLDCMYVRNHILELDIEILKRERKFSDVKKTENYYEDA